ncbi:MAG: ABC transporter ATP-binding protein [Phycisphaerales bacterium]|nr:ABC transporter ATP-binding protein [Phycisphaerales bacterium]
MVMAANDLNARPPLNGTANGGGMAVSCRGVTKTYGTGGAAVRALRGVDLDVRQGELMMLVGPSGCGKTSLISVIAGVLDRDGGDCTVFGEDFARMSSRERTSFRGRNIGFVFQAFNLIPTLNIAENVAVPLLINGWSMVKAVGESRRVLEQVGLGDRWKDVPSRLSGGQQQRVAIARALVHHPRLIVCDEPTSALDHATGEKVMELLKETAVGRGKSLVVVTHDARIFQFADRIARMDDGHIIAVEQAEAVIRQAASSGAGS